MSNNTNNTNMIKNKMPRQLLEQMRKVCSVYGRVLHFYLFIYLFIYIKIVIAQKICKKEDGGGGGGENNAGVNSRRVVKYFSWSEVHEKRMKVVLSNLMGMPTMHAQLSRYSYPEHISARWIFYRTHMNRTSMIRKFSIVWIICSWWQGWGGIHSLHNVTARNALVCDDRSSK